MKLSTQIKILSTASGVFLISTAYAYIQNKSLQREINASSQQCELRANQLLKEPAQTTANQVVTQATPPPAKKPSKTDTASRKAPAQAENAIPEHLKDQPALPSFSESVQDIVKRKYRFLLSTLNLSEQELQQLLELLIQREQLALNLIDAQEFGEELGLSATDIADITYEIEQVDQAISDLLDEQQQERYALLKESDHEQKEFSHFTRGITSLFPLEPAQQEHVLLAKLKRKQQFEAQLEAMGFDMDFPLSQQQKEQQVALLEQYAKQYMEEFLGDVKPHMDHSSYPFDQYTLLENYTKTEFEQLMENLNKKIEARGQY
ncbi:MAG: hypothetical protein KTR17_09460 [Cellvibrionaceae bacterium]|nr:hypothetical protein [Cellvibrionaceae bacterium]